MRSNSDVLAKKASGLSARVERNRNALIILGVIIAAKAALDLAMIGVGANPRWMQILSFLFLLIGAVVSAISALDKSNRYGEKMGTMRALSSQCRYYDRRFMLDYKRFVEPQKPEITLARLDSLIDLQNESLASTRQRCDDLGVDLSDVRVSYRVDGKAEAAAVVPRSAAKSPGTFAGE
jgi:hypothetical protein